MIWTISRVGGRTHEDNFKIAKVCFLAFLPLFFLIGTKHDPGKGWFFLILTTIGFIPLLYISWIHFHDDDDGKNIYILTLIGSMMFLVSALQVQKDPPVGGLGFLLFIQFCIFVYYLVKIGNNTGTTFRKSLIALAITVALVCLMPINVGTIILVVILSLCFFFWFLILFGFMPDKLDKLNAMLPGFAKKSAPE